MRIIAGGASLDCRGWVFLLLLLLWIGFCYDYISYKQWICHTKKTLQNSAFSLSLSLSLWSGWDWRDGLGRLNDIIEEVLDLTISHLTSQKPKTCRPGPKNKNRRECLPEQRFDFSQLKREQQDLLVLMCWKILEIHLLIFTRKRWIRSRYFFSARERRPMQK